MVAVTEQVPIPLAALSWLVLTIVHAPDWTA